MIKAIIFDCFGVVLHDGLRENYEYFGGDFDKDLPQLSHIMHEASAGRMQSSIPHVAKLLGISEQAWRDRHDNGHVVDNEVLAFAKSLKGSYKVAMLSNIGKGGVGRFFEPGVLDQHFDPIVESASKGYAKPEANAYEITADRLGVRCDECIMIDDRPEYCEGARAVGMKAIQFTSLQQLKRDLQELLA